MVSVDICRRILNHLPGGVSLAFSYGSGAFKQTNSDPRNNMLDFILAVNNPEVWHRENLRMNRKHYSFLKYFGPGVIADVQSRYGASVYFNTLVEIQDRYVKYGVISTEKLIQDLLDWNELYVSGRLHKPALFIDQQNSRKELHTAMSTNLRSAVHVACLLLPESFNEVELYSTISGLSYNGDFRMTVGEDKNKINNIVVPNLDRFNEMYKPTLSTASYLERSGDTFKQPITFQSRLHHLSRLPRCVLNTLADADYKKGRYPDVEEILRGLAAELSCEDRVRESVATIVKKSSTGQTAKGVLTAGLWKSVRYGASKLKKQFKSQKR